MKLKSYIYTCLVGAMLLAGCQPDEYSMGGQKYTPETLAEGISYTVKVEGNTVKLQSNIEDCIPLWKLPSGQSQEKSLSISLPFSGTYSVTFGVITPAGPVYAEPKSVKIEKNDFSLVANEMWNYLAGGVDANGKTKAPVKWVPVDRSYGVGNCSACVMYVSPGDVMNDGSGNTDLMFGNENWKPNWDPGFQDWLVPANSAYMDSYMIFGLDAEKGCVATVYRGEEGEKGSSTGKTMNGSFSFNLDDPKHPTITFNNCFGLHSTSMDDVCDNYTKDIKIISLSPYLLQLAYMRTNSEGPWWLVWNFINADVQSGKLAIPSEGPELIKTNPVELPVLDNLYENIFTTEINGVKFNGQEMSFIFDEEAPYDWMWWNGANGAWEGIVGGNYGATWCPPAGDLADSLLVFTKGEDNTLKFTYGEKTSGIATLEEGVLSFKTADGNLPMEVCLLAVEGENRTIEVKGSEFQVLGCVPGEYITLGVPSSTDDAGDVNSYLTVTLKYKPIASGPAGPVFIPCDSEKVQVVFGDGNSDRLRLQFYNAWGGNNDCVDITKLKLKKNKRLTIKYKVLSGITWNDGAQPKTVILENKINGTFEDDCYALPEAVPFNTAPGAEQTVTLDNTTGATVDFETDCCLIIGIQNKGLATVDTDAEGENPDVKIEIISISIDDIPSMS